jgi:NTP pyrophosphatase (non-canonical NTP hydrolase)
MTLNEYQREASQTAAFDHNYVIVYTSLGLNGEAGELAEHAKKLIRDDNGEVTAERMEAVEKEAGDVLWYLSQVCSAWGLDFDTVAKENIRKLRSRQERGQIHGSGSER